MGSNDVSAYPYSISLGSFSANRPYNASVPERLRSVELDPRLTRAFAETFIPRWDCYPLQVENGTYVQIQEKLTLSHIFKHLTNAHLGYKPFTVGAYALDAKSQAKWVCFDADADQQWAELWRLARSLRDAAVPTYLEPSRRGGHLWVFTPVLPGSSIRQFARKLLVMEKIAEYGEDRKRRIEIYPKQDVLGDGAGSFVRLPLGVHQKTGQVYHFIDAEGKPLAPTIREQLAVLGQPNRVSQEFVDVILSKDIEVPAPPPKPSPKFKKRTARHNEPLSESLKHAISVFDFVSQYVHLNEQGRGLCPFHDDHERSFAVNKQRNYWHCFAGCMTSDGNKGGSIIDFWMLWRAKNGQDGSFTATVKELREMLLNP